MTFQPPRDLALAFAHPAAPSFADLIRQLELDTILSAKRLRDLISALRRLAKLLERTPEQVPADLRWLRPRIAKLVPAALGISAKSLTNIRSDAKAALAHCGIAKPREKLRGDLTPEWQPIWDIVSGRKQASLSASLGALVHFASRNGVGPAEVDDKLVADYREALEVSEVAKDPETASRQAIYAWNRAATLFPDWPQQRLTLLSRRDVVVLPPSTFPSSFLEELERYIAWLKDPDPLDDDARRKGLRPATLKLRRNQVLHFASALVRMGEPAESLTGLTSLIEPVRAERGLRWLYERSGRKTHVIHSVADMLRLLARDRIKVDAATQAKFDRLSCNLKLTPEPGLTAKNRERLRQFDDPAVLSRLLRLPDRLMAAADKDQGLRRAHLRREDAVAIAILLHCPIRAQNLDQIHLEENLQRPAKRCAYLVFESEEVKNSRRLEFDLPADVLAIIDRHLALRSPQLCTKESRWLFPRRNGRGPMDQQHLADKVCTTIHRETGITMNLHLFRHLAAKLWLEAHPGQYEALRRLLGHSELSRTIDAYAGFEAGPAAREFAALVAAKRAQ